MFHLEKRPTLPTAALTLCLTLVLTLAVAIPSPAQDQGDLEARVQAARKALNDERFEQAAELYRQVYEARRESEKAGDDLYWEAFARYRLGSTTQLKRAMARLEMMQDQHHAARMAAEGEALAARIAGELAERGEAEYAREVTEMAYEDQVRQETRLAALQSLMHMDRERALPVLRKIVQDDSPGNRELRENAVFILCRDSDEESEGLVIQMLQKETDPEFVETLAMCLARSDSDRALQALMDAFGRSQDPEVRETVLMAVSRHDGDQVFDFLTETFRDRDLDPEIRGTTLMALGRSGHDEEVTDLLIEVLKTEQDEEVLEMALMTLTRMDDPRAGKAILDVVVDRELDEEFRSLALHYAVREGEVDLALLERLYQQSDSRELKQQICHMLTRMDDEDAALEMLIRITKDETDPEIRRDAVFWIGRFDNDKAAEYLMQVINEK